MIFSFVDETFLSSYVYDTAFYFVPKKTSLANIFLRKTKNLSTTYVTT